jgi:predicted TIM-barrel fold metal-dependent hydrolase
LKLIVNEFDISWIPMFMRHCDQVQDDFGKRSGMEPIKMKASDYMRERIYHGLIDEPFAKHNIGLIGAKQVIWGSDFPHHAAMGIDQVNLMAEDVLEGLPEGDKEKIAGATAAQVYGI